MAQMVMGNECIISSGISVSVGWQCTSTTCLRTSFDGRACIDVVSVKERNERNDSWYVTASQISLHATHQIFQRVPSSHRHTLYMFFTSLSKLLLSPSHTHCTARRISSMAHSSSQVIDTSPPRHPIAAGTSSINRELFRKTLSVVAARIPAAKTGAFLKAGELKRYFISGSALHPGAKELIVTRVILDLPKLRSVIPVSDEAGQTEERLVLLGSQSKGKRYLPWYSILPVVCFAEHR